MGDHPPFDRELMPLLASGAIPPTVDVARMVATRAPDTAALDALLAIYKDPRANSYYTNSHGRSVTNCPFPGNEMWHRLRRPDFADVILR